MLAGTPFAHELDFSTGLPTGAVVYSVLGNDNLPITGYSGLQIVPDAGALSLLLVVPGEINTVSTALFEARTLRWTYLTDKGLVSDRIRYRVEKEIPFPVSEHGVRAKLGVEDDEVEDKDINLLLAYARLSSQFNLTPYENAGTYEALVVVDAIEAQAALDVLPSLQLAIANTEDSGTNKYVRFAKVDWALLADSISQSIISLTDMVGSVSVDSFIGVIFTTAGRTTDPVTNADYV